MYQFQVVNEHADHVLAPVLELPLNDDLRLPPYSSDHSQFQSLAPSLQMTPVLSDIRPPAATTRPAQVPLIPYWPTSLLRFIPNQS